MSSPRISNCPRTGCTAAGLTVAIPALIGYRYYRNRVDTLVVDMEKEAIKLVEALHRRQDKA